MRFLLHQSIVPECLWSIHIIIIFSFMKESNCSHKLRHEEYLELICRYLSDDLYNELTCMRISYVIYIYKGSHDDCVSDP